MHDSTKDGILHYQMSSIGELMLNKCSEPGPEYYISTILLRYGVSEIHMKMERRDHAW